MLKIFTSILKRMILSSKRIFRSLKNNLDGIGILIIIVSPAIQLLFANQRDGVITNVMLIWVGMILYQADIRIHNKQYGIPVMRKKFVKYNKANDMVSIKKDDWNEVVNYMADLQEYFEKEGML